MEITRQYFIGIMNLKNYVRSKCVNTKKNVLIGHVNETFLFVDIKIKTKTKTRGMHEPIKWMNMTVYDYTWC